MCICKTCGETDISKFGIHSTSKKPHGYCRKCRNARHRDKAKEYYSSERGRTIKSSSDKKYYENNKDKIRIYNKQYRAENSKKLSLKKEIYYSDNKDYILFKCSEYKRNNKGKVNFWSRQRSMSKQQRAVNYGELNDLIIEEAYLLSQERSKLTGISWHVDHVHPLNPRDKLSCGLHVGINLQVIPALENLKKSNKPYKI